MSRIISIEGGEGSGKGTVIEKLKQRYPHILFTREPGGTKISEQIRNVIVDKNNTELSYEAEALLYAAARAQLMKEEIIPALKDGKTIIFDRFIDSSLVYQGYARGLGIEQVNQINMMAIGNNLPAMTIYLDVNPEIGLARIAQNNRETNRLDLESMNFHKKVRDGYLTVAQRYPKRFRIVDASQSPEKVFDDVVKLLETFDEFKGCC